MKNKIIALLLAATVYLVMIFSRLSIEARHLERGGHQRTIIGSTWDPRNYQKINRTIRRRETDAFRNQLIKGDAKGFLVPGLGAAQVSWAWLNLLQSVHYDSSYEGDFSWMFSKIYFILAHAHPKEIFFVRGLAPFYLVIGKDHPGANIVTEEIQKRNNQDYQIFFWSGFHAMMNLFHPKMAAWMYREAAKLPHSPQYLAALSYKLEYGEETVSSEELLGQVLEKEADPKIAQLIKETRLKILERARKK